MSFRHVTMALLVAVSASAQAADFKVGLQARPRLEKSFGGNLGAVPGGNNYQLTQRTRVHLDAAVDFVRARVSIQDVRLWASEHSSLSDFSADDIDFHEGYVEVGNDWLTLRIGRQEITLNDGRLIGAPDFSQASRAFDAARLTFHQTRMFNLDFVYARVTELGVPQDLFVLNPTMRFGPLDLRLPLHLQTNSGVNERERGANPKQWARFTGGLYVAGAHGQLHWRAEGYGQLGDDPRTAFSQVAYMFGVEARYRLSEMLSPVLSVDYLSGDTDHVDSQSETFDTLFADDHRFFGSMDRFTNIPRDTRDGGLVDIKVGNDGKIGPGRLQSDVHLLLFAQENADGQRGPLGVEVDLAYGVPIVERVTIEAGFSLFFDAGEFTTRRDPITRALLDKNKTVHDWLYLMLDISI